MTQPSAPILTPVVGIPATITTRAGLRGQATFDSPYLGGPVGAGVGSVPFEWDATNNRWKNSNTNAALQLPLARADVPAAAKPQGWLYIDLTWTDEAGRRQSEQLRFRPAAGEDGKLDLTRDQDPEAYTTTASLQALTADAEQAAAAANTAAGRVTDAILDLEAGRQAVADSLTDIAQAAERLEAAAVIRRVANEAALTGQTPGIYELTGSNERLTWDGVRPVPGSRGPILLGTGVNDFPVPAGSTGASTRYAVIPERAALRVGVYESGEHDDQLAFFRNRVPSELANIGIGSTSFGRENLTFGYLSGAVGHSNSAYGVASVAFGAGNATGNPDSPLNGDGYCAVVGGKNSWARGAKSVALGEHVVTHARAGSASGYHSQAGDEVGGDMANQAHGYRARSDGTFAGAGGGAWGANLWARKGSFLFGSGYDESNPYVTPADSIHQAGVVLRGKVVVLGDLQDDYVTVWNGYGTGTNKPQARHDFRISAGETIDVLLETAAGSVGRLRLRGLDNNGQPVTLGAIEYSHENGGSPVGRLRFYTANGGALSALPQFAVNSDGSVEVQGGVQVGGTGLTVNGTRVVGGQLAGIPHVPVSGDAALNAAAINRILGVMEAHGLTGIGPAAPSGGSSGASVAPSTPPPVVNEYRLMGAANSYNVPDQVGGKPLTLANGAYFDPSGQFAVVPGSAARITGFGTPNALTPAMTVVMVFRVREATENRLFATHVGVNDLRMSVIVSAAGELKIEWGGSSYGSYSAAPAGAIQPGQWVCAIMSREGNKVSGGVAGIRTEMLGIPAMPEASGTYGLEFGIASTYTNASPFNGDMAYIATSTQYADPAHFDELFSRAQTAVQSQGIAVANAGEAS